MTVTVKLDPALEERLRVHAAGNGTTTSDVIRAALTAYLADDTAPRGVSALAHGQGLFGRYGGDVDLAGDRKRHLADVWADKHARHGR